MGLGNFFKFMMRWSIFTAMYDLDGSDKDKGSGIGGPIEGYMFNKMYKRFYGWLPGFPDREDYEDDDKDDDESCGYSPYDDDDDY